jgi:hypothetical protein
MFKIFFKKNIIHGLSDGTTLLVYFRELEKNNYKYHYY